MGGLLSPSAVLAALVDFMQSSDPVGLISQISVVDTPANVLTMAAPMESAGYRFTHWTINGIRTNDSTGRALNPAALTIYEATEAVAHYMLSTNDADADLVPDWYEIHFIGSTNQAADAETDGDGIGLLAEYIMDCHPRLNNDLTAGGVAQRNSSQTQIILNPAFHVYDERSDPPGFVSRQLVVSNGSWVASQSLGGENSGYSFAYWKVNGVRQQDGNGIALSQFGATITGATTAIAYYISSTSDMDEDQIPDWYEWKYLGSISNSSASDSDGDGIALFAEYNTDCNPAVSNAMVAGGIAQRNSDLVPINLSGYKQYAICSDPIGLIPAVSEIVPVGTIITTPSIYGDNTGYSFSYWTVNGILQSDIFGLALNRISIAITGTTSAVAHYFATSADTDGDEISDWYEWQQYGVLDHGSESDTDGDGISLLQEYRWDSTPAISNSMMVGGVAQRNSAVVGINLQLFERMRNALVDGVLTEIYSYDPHVVTGWDLGELSSVVLGDWDGDGDGDMFLAHAGGLKVYENIGTRRTVNLSEQSDQFAGLAALIAGIESPVLSMGDFNGDGYEDLAIGGQTGVVRLVQSSGNFTGAQPGSATHVVDVNSSRALPGLGDLNGDGRADLLAIVSNGTANAYFHSGTNLAPYEAFSADYLGQPVTNASGIGIANVDFAGLSDVIVADAEGRMWEFFNQGGGSFFLKSKVWAGAHQGFASRLAIAPHDYDGDGDTDVLAGMENGGLIGLRDPRVRRPTGLTATPGAVSILLTWDPDPQSRIKGYHVYRSGTENGTYARLNASLLMDPRFEDQTAEAATEYWYYVTGVTEAYYPGNSHPVTVESAASDKVSVTAEEGRGSVTLRVKPGHGAAGHNVKIRLVLDESVGIQGEGLALQITYPVADLTPRSQVEPDKATVLDSGLSRNLVLTNDSATASGSFTITGSGGETLPGKGTFLTVNFIIGESVEPGSLLGVIVSSATMRDTDGNLLNVTIIPGGIIDVDGTYVDGDLTGEGVVDFRDEDLLKELIKPNSRDPTDEELLAGDLNGDGELDQQDWLMLKKLLAGKPME